jgi:SAM-dependent methyltransferase
MKSWHEQDDFWITMGPSMFTEDRMAAASNEVNQIIGLVELSLEAEILDMGCGPGRHSLAFARQGFKVTGVDRTAHYLDQAKKPPRGKNYQLSLFRMICANIGVRRPSISPCPYTQPLVILKILMTI